MTLLIVSSQTSAVAVADEPKSDRPTSRYNAKGKRDPFIPLVRDGRIVDAGGSNPMPIDLANPVLSGVLFDPGGQSLALINEMEVKAGDRVGDYRVAEIRQDGVVLVRPDGTSVVLMISFEEEETPNKSPQDARGGEGR